MGKYASRMPCAVSFARELNGVAVMIQVDLSKLSRVAIWSRDYTMEKILVALREYVPS